MPREVHKNCLSSTKWSDLKPYVHVTLYRLESLFIYLVIHNKIYVCVTMTIFLKRGHNWKENRKAYMRGFEVRKEKGKML